MGARLGWLLLFCLGLRAAAQEVPRGEYPRPDFARAQWRSLNGPWSFAFDDADQGLAQHWEGGSKLLARTIVVPYAFETRLSGIGDTGAHDVFWYRREIAVPAEWAGKRVLLQFGAVNYDASVWVNGEFCAEHHGGQTGFVCDATDHLRGKKNTVTVRVHYATRDRSLPRGKQTWTQAEGIFYDRTTGIWQPVWMEPVDAAHLAGLRVTPDVDGAQVRVEGRLSRVQAGAKLRVTASLGSFTQTATQAFQEDAAGVTLTLRSGAQGQQLWSPEHPALYDLRLEVLDAQGVVLDTVTSYFGQRKIGISGGKVTLNNEPYYLRLVLDQGYWPESLLTPPTDAAMIADIRATKAFGFNGVRKHQKVEDPRWLYWADRMGLLVWGEMADAQDFDAQYVERMTREWMEVVAQSYNHPSIMAWVPVNESWGIRPEPTAAPERAAHLESLYYVTKALDQTRLVIDNDGWEHTGATDLLTLHDYSPTRDALEKNHEGLRETPPRLLAVSPENHHAALLPGFRYAGQPVVLTEFGGIAYRPDTTAGKNDFGYYGPARSQVEMLTRMRELVDGVLALPLAGYCYTQLTDVQQEVNGLETFDRKAKADAGRFAEIFGRNPGGLP